MHLALKSPGPLLSNHIAEKGIPDLIKIFSSLKGKKKTRGSCKHFILLFAFHIG